MWFTYFQQLIESLRAAKPLSRPSASGQISYCPASGTIYSTCEMARTSGRLSAAAKASVTHKRVASTTAAPDAAVKRSKTATPTKSEYFKSPDDDDDDDDESGDESPKAGDNASAFGSDDEGVQSTSEADEGDDYESEANSKLRKRATPRGSTATGSGISTTNSGTGLGPGKQLIIQKLKPRAAGKIPYTDDSIHPNTFLFLEELEANNDRAWLKSK